MNITPRNSEIEAVVKVLDDGMLAGLGYPELAKTLIKCVYASMLDRDWWAYFYRMAPSRVLLVGWCPFTSRSEAERFARKLALAEGDHLIVKLSGPANSSRLADATATQLTPEDRDDQPR